MKSNPTIYVFLLCMATFANAGIRTRRQETKKDYTMEGQNDSSEMDNDDFDMPPDEEVENEMFNKVNDTANDEIPSLTDDDDDDDDDDEEVADDVKPITKKRDAPNQIQSLKDKFKKIVAKVKPVMKLEKFLQKYNGNLVAKIDKEYDQEPVIHVEGTEQFWKSKDGKNSIQGEGYYDKQYNSKGELEDSYGGKLSLSGSLLNKDDGTGCVGIGLNCEPDQGTQLKVNVSQGLWKSADGMNELRGDAYYKRQIGPETGELHNVGGQLVYEGRPAVPFVEYKDPVMALVRVNHQLKGDSDVYLEGNANLWSSKNNSVSVQGKAYYQQNFSNLEGLNFSRLEGQNFSMSGGQNYGAELEVNKDDFRLEFDLKKEPDEAPRLHVDVNHKLWKSPNAKDAFEANAYYDRNFENTSDTSNQKFGFGLVVNHLL